MYAEIGPIGIEDQREEAINAGYKRLVERIVSSGVHYNEFFPDGFSFSPEPDQLARVRTALDTAFGTISARESRVLVLRNGLDGETPKSLTQAGLILDKVPLSRERVRQIEVKALRKLRHPSRGLNEVLGEALGRDHVVVF